MTLPQYRRLADACDRLLRQGIQRPERLAFSFLHVLGPHPSQLAKFEPQGGQLESPPGRFAVYSGLRIMAGLAAPNRISDLWKKNRLPRIRHLIVSHEIGAETRAGDFYFGRLPAWLAELGGHVMILKINHRGWRHGSLRSQQTAPGVHTMTLPGWAAAKRETFLPGMVLREIGRIRRDCAAGSKVGRQILQVLQGSSTKLAAAQNLRFYFWLKEILQTLKPANLFFTWEGHAWERLLIRAAREDSPQTLCIGYQHTILFPHALGPFRSLGPSHDPDQIWTVGTANLRGLRSVWEKRGVKILQYGSPRHRRYPTTPCQKKEDLCQIAPEGILSEAVRLFRFGHRLAKLAPKIRFDFRCHPVLPFSQVAAKCPDLQKLPPNVRIKNRSSPGDLGKARWFIYRGTSLVFEAVAAGTRPFYVTRKGEIAIDPLQDLKVWKKVVKTPQDALRQIQEDKKNGKPGPFRGWQNAQRWARGFFLPENKDLPKRLESSATRGRMHYGKN